MRAGYSKRSLADKLGIKPEMRLALLGAPEGYDNTLGKLPPGVMVSRAVRGKFDLVQLFVDRSTELDRRLPALRKAIAPDGMIWVSWPKKVSGVETDVTEAVVRDRALAHGLVDVKVCAVDETWSGLKLVIRLKDRVRASGGTA
ncbi:MAG: DUF3052 family protein [Acidobacteriota bacterium]